MGIQKRRGSPTEIKAEFTPELERALRYATTLMFVKCQNMDEGLVYERNIIWGHIKELSLLMNEYLDDEVPPPTNFEEVDIDMEEFYSKRGRKSKWY